MHKIWWTGKCRGRFKLVRFKSDCSCFFALVRAQRCARTKAKKQRSQIWIGLDSNVTLLMVFTFFPSSAMFVALGQDTERRRTENAVGLPWLYIIIAQHAVHEYPCLSFPFDYGRLKRKHSVNQNNQTYACHHTQHAPRTPQLLLTNTGDATTKLNLLTSPFKGSRVRAWWKWCRALQFSSSKMATQGKYLWECPSITRYLALI